MDIAPLLDDELLDGYRGRLSVLNHARSKPEIHKIVKASYPVAAEFSGQGQSTFVPSMVNALGISLEVLLCKHTMWPLFAAFPDESSPRNQEKFRYSPSNSSVWLKAARNCMWMCAQCIQEDLDKHYFSYWRRSHQLPGRFFCPEHGRPLRFCVTPSFLSVSPDAVLESSAMIDKKLLGEVESSKWAQATVAILSGILTAEDTIDREAVTRIFRDYSGLGSGEASDTNVVKTLSALISRSFSQEWLKDLMPNAKLINGDRLQFVVAALTSARAIGLSAAAAAIVAAHFIDAHEAIQILTLTD